MKTFKDTHGRTWTVCITVDAVRRVRSLLSVNLLEVADGNLIEKLVDDPVLLCDVLYAVLKPDCEAQNVSDADFGRALSGDVIEQATTALLESLIDFFPPAKRRILSKALEKMRVLQERALRFAETKIDSPEIDQQFEDALKNITGSSSSLPGSSASIQAR